MMPRVFPCKFCGLRCEVMRSGGQPTIAHKIPPCKGFVDMSAEDFLIVHMNVGNKEKPS